MRSAARQKGPGQRELEGENSRNRMSAYVSLNGSAGFSVDELAVFFLRYFTRYRLAELSKSGEIPDVREVSALLWLHRLNRAFRAIEEDAFAVHFLNERQALPVLPDPGIGLDKPLFRHPFKLSHLADFVVGDLDLSGPPTTGRAALAFIKDRHFGFVYLPALR